MTRAVGIGVLLTTMSVAGFRQDERLFGESIGLEFVVIEPEAFRMGSRDGDRDERPVHTVTISRPYELGVYEVTQAQWFAVMGTSVGEQFALARRAVGRADFQSLRGIGDNYPMYLISWTEAQAYIGRLNSLDAAYAYRLPMEAEWEYAARAGSTTAYSFGDDTERLSEHAWYCGNADATHPVVGASVPTLGVSTTCMGMCGSGRGLLREVRLLFGRRPDGSHVGGESDDARRRMGKSSGEPAIIASDWQRRIVPELGRNRHASRATAEGVGEQDASVPHHRNHP